jgi:Ca2+:H+ antiporter
MSLFDQGTELVGRVRSPEGKLQTKELLDVCRSILPIVGVLQRYGQPIWVAAGPRAQLCARRRPPPPATPRILARAAADKLGTGFMIVKHDVGGNIDRLATCAATKPDEYQADVFAMVRDDVAAGTNTGSSSVMKGLLWLKRCACAAASVCLPGHARVPVLCKKCTRHTCPAPLLLLAAQATSTSVVIPLANPCSAMEFIVALLERLYADRTIALSTAASEVYYETLQRFHGWIVTGTFTVALKLVPSRDDFFNKVGVAPGDEGAMAAMHAFCMAFSGVLAEIQTFLAANGLDDPAKV